MQNRKLNDQNKNNQKKGPEMDYKKQYNKILQIRRSVLKFSSLVNKINQKGVQVKYQQQRRIPQALNNMSFFMKSLQKLNAQAFLQGLGIKTSNEQQFSFNQKEDLHSLYRFLQQPVGKRKQTQVIQFMKAFRETYFYKFYESAFEKHPQYFDQAVQSFEVENYKQFQYVIHSGDFANRIFIVLEGEIAVLIPDVDITEKQLISSLFKLKSLAQPQDGEEEEFMNEKEVEENISQMEFKNINEYLETINPGFRVLSIAQKLQYIGDEFVRYKTQYKYTLQCTEQTHVATLSSVFFFQIIPELESLKIFETIKFLQMIPVFNNFTDDCIEVLARNYQIQEYHTGSVIYDQGEKPEFMYIIMDGEVEIASYVRQSQMVQHYQSIDEYLGTLRQKERQKQWNHKGNQKSVKSRRTVVLLSKGQYFGEDELISNQGRKFQAVSKSHACKIIKVQRKLYIDLLFSNKEKFQEINDKVKQSQDLKQMVRDQLINQIQKIENMYEEQKYQEIMDEQAQHHGHHIKKDYKSVSTPKKGIQSFNNNNSHSLSNDGNGENLIFEYNGDMRSESKHKFDDKFVIRTTYRETSEKKQPQIQQQEQFNNTSISPSKKMTTLDDYYEISSVKKTKNCNQRSILKAESTTLPSSKMSNMMKSIKYQNSNSGNNSTTKRVFSEQILNSQKANQTNFTKFSEQFLKNKSSSIASLDSQTDSKKTPRVSKIKSSLNLTNKQSRPSLVFPQDQNTQDLYNQQYLMSQRFMLTEDDFESVSTIPDITETQILKTQGNFTDRVFTDGNNTMKGNEFPMNKRSSNLDLGQNRENRKKYLNLRRNQSQSTQEDMSKSKISNSERKSQIQYKVLGNIKKIGGSMEIIESNKKKFDESRNQVLNYVVEQKTKNQKNNYYHKPFMNYEEMKDRFENFGSETNLCKPGKFQLKKMSMLQKNKEYYQQIDPLHEQQQDLYFINSSSRQQVKQINQITKQNQRVLGSLTERKEEDYDYQRLALHSHFDLDQIAPETKQGKITRNFKKQIKVVVKQQHDQLMDETNIKIRNKNLPDLIQSDELPVDLSKIEHRIPNPKAFTTREKYIFCKYFQEYDDPANYANFQTDQKNQYQFKDILSHKTEYKAPQIDTKRRVSIMPLQGQISSIVLQSKLEESPKGKKIVNQRRKSQLGHGFLFNNSEKTKLK